jgi:hypothetical protein
MEEVDSWYAYKMDNQKVKTTNASGYDPKTGNFAVVGVNTRRSWKKNFSDAVEHATHLIDAGNSDEFLIVKVVGRVKRKPTPVIVTWVK